MLDFAEVFPLLLFKGFSPLFVFRVESLLAEVPGVLLSSDWLASRGISDIGETDGDIFGKQELAHPGEAPVSVSCLLAELQSLSISYPIFRTSASWPCLPVIISPTGSNLSEPF